MQNGTIVDHSEATLQQLGFVGLGTMGFPICRNLAQSGVRVVAYDLYPLPDRVATLRDVGVRVVERLSDVGEACELLVAVLPDSDASEQVFLDCGLLERMRPGALCVDMTSGYPRTTIRMGKALAERGIRLVDSPICGGGAIGAEAGKLTVCVGGEPTDVAEVRALLEPVISQFFHVGPLGSGHAMKILNNYFGFVYSAAIAEGLALGVAYGFDLKAMVSVLQKCSAGNQIFNRQAEVLAEPPPDKVGFQLKLATKDLRYASALAGELREPLVTGQAAHSLYELATLIMGPGVEAHQGVWRLLEHIHGMERGLDA